MSDNWPDLEYAEEITFEGCARLAIAPEEYEALLSSHADLQARLAECERDRDEANAKWRGMATLENAQTAAANAIADTLRAQLAETQNQRMQEKTQFVQDLKRVFQLGQTYWAQADSMSFSQNRRADQTLHKFREIVAKYEEKPNGN